MTSFRHIETLKRTVPQLPRPWNESPFPRTTPPRVRAPAANESAKIDTLEGRNASPATEPTRAEGANRGVAIGGIIGGSLGMLVSVGGLLLGSAEVALTGGLLPFFTIMIGGIIGTASPRTLGTGAR